MKTKLVFSFISAVIFAVAAYLVNTEMLDFVHARFYNPSVVNSVNRENAGDAEIVQSHISELQLKFAAALDEKAVRNSFLHNQNAEDIFERSRIFGILMESTGGLQLAQFVDSNGIRLHYSTSARDVLSQTSDSTAYRNYNENALVLPFDRVNAPSDGGSKFIMDEFNDRIIFSYPFRDSMDVYRGTALFYVSVRALADKLTLEGSLTASDNVSLIEMPPGIVFGTPDTSRAEILNKTASIWSNGILDNVTLDAEDSGVEFSLISTKTGQGIFVGRLVNSSIFAIPKYMKIVLLLSMFLTFYLLVIFLVNLRVDPAVLVQNRIDKLKKSLFARLDEDNLNRGKFVFELEQRRDEIRRELKQKLRISRSKEKRIDSLIDKSWNELLAEIKVDGGGMAPVCYAKTAPVDRVAEEAEEIEEIGEIEEIDEIAEEIEEVEEIDEVEEIGEVEELAEIEEADEIDEIEEIAEIEEVEEIDEVEELEEIEEISSLDEDAPTPPVLETKSPISEPEVREPQVREPEARGLLARSVRAREKVSADDAVYESPVRKPKVSGRGLLAHASAIEFNDKLSAEDLTIDLEIVSPFAYMFASLNDIQP